MQTIKAMKEGRTIYKIPKGYKPLRHTSSWLKLNSSKEGICNKIMEAGWSYYNQSQNEGFTSKKRFKHPVLLIRYYFYLYLSGCKPLAPLTEIKTIELIKEKERKIAKVTKLDGIITLIPIYCESESQMWEFVTDAWTETRASQIFEPNYLPKDTRKLRVMLESAFRLEIKLPEGGQRKVGIAPNLLRNMRLDNLYEGHKAKLETLYDILGSQALVARLVFQKRGEKEQQALLKSLQ